MAGQPIGSLPQQQGEGRADHPHHKASLHPCPSHPSGPDPPCCLSPQEAGRDPGGEEERWTPRAGPLPPSRH